MPLLLMIITLGLSLRIYAIEFFSKDIDYWNENKKVEKIEKAEEIKRPSQFDWEKVKDPKNKEFFKEGDYTPPEAFMELARNPTNENIKNWFDIMELKNQLMGKLQERMKEYMQQKGGSLKLEEKTVMEEEVKKLEPKKNIDTKRFRFLLYFESSCPHCQNMMATAKELQDLGYYVEVRQIDRERPRYAIPFALIPATKDELTKKNITSWPVLFIADTTKQLIYRMNGYQTTSQVIAEISNK